MYKVKDESEQHYEIQTPEGHSFHVAKEGLSKKMHENIKKMYGGGAAHYADGTDAASLEDVPEAPISDSSINESNTLPPVQQETPVPQPSQGAIPAPNVAANVNTNIPLSGDAQKLYEEGLQQQTKGVMQEAQAKATGAEEQGNQLLTAQKDIANAIDTHSKDLVNERNNLETLASDIAKAPPQRESYKQYFSKESTPQKIATVSSLILGMFTGGPQNAGLAAMQSEIEKDLENEKAVGAAKDTLYSRNFDLYKNDQIATAATLAQKSAVADGILRAQAIQNGSPQALAAAQQASGAMKQNAAGYLFQRQLFNLRGDMKNMSAVPVESVRVADKPQNFMANGDGTATYTDDPKKYQEIKAQYDPFINTMTELEHLSANPIRPNSPEYQRAKSLLASAAGQYKDVVGGRLNDQVLKLFEQGADDPTSVWDKLKNGVATRTSRDTAKKARDIKLSPITPSLRLSTGIPQTPYKSPNAR